MKTTRILVLLGSCSLMGGAALWMPGCSSTSTNTDGGGGDSGNADSGGGGDSGGGDSGGLSVSCTNYCNTIKTSCTGANQQYADDATCMAVCGAFTLGSAGDSTMNTVACRQYHAGAAAGGATAAGTHCPHAGPWGGGACGTVCDGYCTVETKLCTGNNAQFANTGECTTACGAWTAGDAGASSGNSLACREYHMLVASQMQAAHCPHTGNKTADAGSPCGP
jgi:hypothetical protein